MLSRHSLTALSSAERQLLRRQWLSSGQCVRCFHASLRREAEIGSGQQNQGERERNDRGTPYNQPQRGPTRHQRAAQISEEVRMLNRETPPGPSKPPNDSADFAVGPHGTGELATPGRMGENMSPGREGPFNQGVGRAVRPQDDMEADEGTQQIRGSRTPTEGVEDPTQGGASLMEGEAAAQAANKTGKVARPAEEEEGEEEEHDEEEDDGVPQQPDLVTQAPPTRRGPRISAPGVPYQPSGPTTRDLIHASTNASTIAAANFEGVLNDSIRQIADQGQDPAAGSRDLQSLANKLISGQIAHFSSSEERDAALELVYKLKGPSGAKLIADGRLSQKSIAKLRPEQKEEAWFRPLRESIRKSMVERLAGGVYDTEGFLEGKQKHKQPVLNEISKLGLKNGTYLPSDSERFLKKVQSLLPAATAQRGPQKQGGRVGGAGGGAGAGSKPQRQQARK